jgi:hypothetical protein
MKKSLIVTTLLLAFASSAFAAGTDMASGSLAGEGAAIYGGSDTTVAAAATTPIVKLSTGVNGVAYYNTVAYAISTKHSKGSKVFGTANDSTSIFWKASPAAAMLAADGGSTSGNANFNGWTTY